MNIKNFARPALNAAIFATALAIFLPGAGHADGLKGRNDARGPIVASQVATAAISPSAGRNATPRGPVVAPGAKLAQACSDPSGRNFARTANTLSCADMDADGAPEI